MSIRECFDVYIVQRWYFDSLSHIDSGHLFFAVIVIHITQDDCGQVAVKSGEFLIMDVHVFDN